MAVDIRSLNLSELYLWFEEHDIPKFRANQVFEWLHNKGVSSIDDMNNIPKELKTLLKKSFSMPSCIIDTKLTSNIDDTVKYLYKLTDSEFVECVVMKYKYGYSVCISTQVGCKMGCKFCASAIGGFIRNLTVGEMLDEIYSAQRDLNIKINHIVLMGTGEPLDNYDNVVKFLELITCEKGQNVSIRHISLSTCGIVPKIYQLADKKLGITLSVSLHAPNNFIRNQSMPINAKYDIDELLNACKYYASETNRRISFEYAMIKGVNDSDECAIELAERLKGLLCHVNLIPVNNVRERSYIKSTVEQQKRFIDVLSSYGIPATVRRTLGSDINASCGQLRASKRKVGEFICE